MRLIIAFMLLAICNLSFAATAIKCRLKNDYCERLNAIDEVSFCRWRILTQEDLDGEDATTLRYKKIVGSTQNKDGSDAKEIIQFTEVNRYTGDAIVTKRFYQGGSDIGPYTPFFSDVPGTPIYMTCQPTKKMF